MGMYHSQINCKFNFWLPVLTIRFTENRKTVWFSTGSHPALVMAIPSHSRSTKKYAYAEKDWLQISIWWVGRTAVRNYINMFTKRLGAIKKKECVWYVEYKRAFFTIFAFLQLNFQNVVWKSYYCYCHEKRSCVKTQKFKKSGHRSLTPLGENTTWGRLLQTAGNAHTVKTTYF